VSTKNGLPGNYVTSIIDDIHGYLWVTADAGIFRLSKDEFDRAVNDPRHRLLYHLYDKSDGVSDTPVCRGEPRVTRDQHGLLWFTSVSGAIVLDPNRVRHHHTQVVPAVERLVADGSIRTANDTLLRPGTSNVDFHYTAANLSDGEKLRFQYRLSNFDRSW